jgi:hypothetical protein
VGVGKLEIKGRQKIKETDEIVVGVEIKTGGKTAFLIY